MRAASSSLLALALTLVGACTSKGTQTQLEPASEPASEPDPVIVEPSPNENRRELSPLLGGSVVVHSPTPGRWASRVDFDQHYYVTMEHVIRNSMRGSAVLRLDDDGHARACFETVKYDSSDMSHYQAQDHKDHHYANEFAMVVGMSGTWSRPSADAPEIEVRFDRMNWRTCEVDPTREPFEQPALRCVAVAANAKIPSEALLCQVPKELHEAAKLALLIADSPRAGSWDQRFEPSGHGVAPPEDALPWLLLGAEPGFELAAKDHDRDAEPLTIVVAEVGDPPPLAEEEGAGW